MNKETAESIDLFIGKMEKSYMQNGTKRVVFEKDPTFELPSGLSSFYLDLIISELTDNCNCQGAEEIKVTLSGKTLKVEDNVFHPDAEEVVKRLNQINSSEDKKNEKKWKDNRFNNCGGIGISELVLGILENTGGCLKYFADEGKIFVQATWV